jgi:hypothetical protein
MATQDVHAPTLGAQGEPCATCGAPLAADQRYCLQCGERRVEARLPFLDILAGRGVAPARGVVATETTTVERAPRGLVARIGHNTAAVAGVGCLLLALGVGVLIGGIGDDGSPSASAAPPQVISVGGVAPAAAVTSTATPAATDASGAASSSTKAKKKQAKASGDAGDSAPAVKTKATNKALEELDTASPEEYQKKAAKLPKTVGTGGAAPPKDDKPAAGGGAFEEIG